ncbi:MAG: hypothetical protein HY747_01480 [Elusimicrobia bacterium]|nr:hypothetical protein [Elusimicrobiota bacterium]
MRYVNRILFLIISFFLLNLAQAAGRGRPAPQGSGGGDKSSRLGRPWSIGLGQDNINILLPVGKKWAYQGRLGGVSASSGNGVYYLGSSLRRYFPKTPILDFYLSPDINISHFDVDQAKGLGAALGATVGIEYRLRPRLGLSFDIGPYWIYLRNFEPAITRQSWEWIVNTNIHFYIR